MGSQGKNYGENAFRFAAEFCFPRLSGSKGDEDAQETARRIFSALGLSPQEDRFPASYLLINFFARVALLPFGVLLILAAVFYRSPAPYASLIFSALALVAGLGFALYCQSSPIFPGRHRHESRNIFARTGPDNPDQEFVVVGHYDSKSQTFPIWFRILSYYVAGFFSLFVAAAGVYLGVVHPGSGSKFSQALPVLDLCAGVLDFVPLFNRLGNRSPGAVDNASAVGVGFELARIFSEDPLKRGRFWMVLTGAEELGLPGRKTDPELNSVIRNIAAHNSLRFQMVRASLGFSTDAQPFLAAGYRAVSLGFVNRWMHTGRDSVDKLIASNLGDYVKILEQAIRKIDDR